MDIRIQLDKLIYPLMNESEVIVLSKSFVVMTNDSAGKHQIR